MKLNKKSAVALSFILGATMFVSNAIADVVSKTGYEQLKDSIKTTCSRASDNLKNFTAQATCLVKDGDKKIVSLDLVDKYDNANLKNRAFIKGIDEYGRNLNEDDYCDKYGVIAVDSDSYTIYKYKKMGFQKIKSPFTNDREKDVEKVFDTVIGNLKDYVAVTDKQDGSKEYSCALDESQMPGVLNAVTSFIYKERNREVSTASLKQIDKSNYPKLTDDIFIKNYNLKVNVNKDGLADNVFMTGVLSGKDEKGKVHNISFEILVNLTDINSTVITKPDFKGKKKYDGTVEKINGRFGDEYLSED